MLIRAMIIDDEPLARLDIRNSLNQFPDVEVIAEADNATDAIAIIEEKQPDVLFLDIQLPGRNGFELLEDLATIPPKVVFMVLI